MAKSRSSKAAVPNPKKTKTKAKTAKPATAVAPPAPVEADPALQTPLFRPVHYRLLTFGVVVLSLVAICGLTAVGLRLAYAGRIYPGVWANGAYLGGLTPTEARTTVDAQTKNYLASSLIIVQSGTQRWRIDPAKIDAGYNNAAAVSQALAIGRTGSPWQQFGDQIAALVGQTTKVGTAHLNASKLYPYLSVISNALDQPVSNASLGLNGSQLEIASETDGQRFDSGRLILDLLGGLNSASLAQIQATVVPLRPQLTSLDLDTVINQANLALSGPVTLKSGSSVWTIDPATVLSWFDITSQTTSNQPGWLAQFYPSTNQSTINLNHSRIAAYVSSIAAKIDTPGQNAQLAITDGRATIFVPSQNGQSLDQTDAVTQIIAALARAVDNRTITLVVKTQEPDVTADKLNNLGIKELISEGVTDFSNSTAARLVNVFTGAAKFNGVLIKPGEEFSFNQTLGPVGPETGYVPELVILQNEVTQEYGGGLCQVSSTAFRAALLAGLPITARTNHSYIVPYYTWPFKNPGVDATIFLPDPDLKFINDTGSYILIQTHHEGTKLYFDFYGTKTKTGRVNEPYFTYGPDAQGYSTTAFTRDILDLAGNVTKTDTFKSYYQPATNFPHVKNTQFN